MARYTVGYNEYGSFAVLIEAGDTEHDEGVDAVAVYGPFPSRGSRRGLPREGRVPREPGDRQTPVRRRLRPRVPAQLPGVRSKFEE